VATGDVYQAIADPTRRHILELLAESERPVKELIGAFRVSQPAISQHLKVLRDAGLVRTRRQGTQICYSLTPSAVRELQRVVARLAA
jgi:DNA-binding transcriptional ArsR family regulator